MATAVPNDELNGEENQLRSLLDSVERQARISAELDRAVVRVKMSLDGNNLLLKKLCDRMLEDIEEMRRTRVAIEKLAAGMQSMDGNFELFFSEISARIKDHTEQLGAHGERVGTLEFTQVAVHKTLDDKIERIDAGYRENTGAVKLLASKGGEGGEKEKGTIVKIITALPDAIREFGKLSPFPQFLIALMFVALFASIALHLAPKIAPH